MIRPRSGRAASLITRRCNLFSRFWLMMTQPAHPASDRLKADFSVSSPAPRRGGGVESYEVDFAEGYYPGGTDECDSTGFVRR
jgi:hypothetical protein